MKQSVNLTTGASGTTVRDTLLTAHNVVAKPRLIADWNWNRYNDNVYADNIFRETDYGFDPVNFPINSIIEPLRPSKGILKARVGEAVVSAGYPQPLDAKFYVSSPEDQYKYWTSPIQTDASGNFTIDGTLGSWVQPYVLYSPKVKTNKIVIRMDNTFASPSSYSVQIATVLISGPDPEQMPVAAASWTTVGGANPAYNTSTGVLTLYYNGTAWVTTRPATLVTTNVAGIKLTVNSLSGGINRDGTALKFRQKTKTGPNYNPAFSGATTGGQNASFNLIAIEAHYEVDFSDRLIGVSDEFDMSDVSQLYPVGTITSNQATVTLDNTDHLLNYDNVSSPYYKIMERNVEFNLEYIYTISGTQYSVQQFKMYSETWQVGDDDTVTVDLDDYSKFLKDIKPNQIFYENNPVTQLVWRVCDSIGFNDYDIQLEDITVDHIIPVFWTTGEQTVWEVLNSLAEATQTAIYFDGFGKLQVRTREAAFNTAATPAATLYGQLTSGNLANIISLDQNQDFETNKVNVIYRTTNWKTDINGNPALSVVWQPDGDLVVRSAALVESLTTTSTYLRIPQNMVSYWPYESKVEVDGEILSYSGKHFIYFTGSDGSTLNWAFVKSQDEYDMLNKQTLPEYRYKNSFSGYLLIEERGLWQTTANDHPVDFTGYHTKMVTNDQTSPTTYNNVTNTYWTPGSSVVTIIAHPYMNGPNDLYFINRDNSSSSGYQMHGTRLYFGGGYQTNRAGLGIRQAGNEEDGYFAELRPSSTIANRAAANEITLFRRNSRNWTVMHSGFPLPIAEGIWYDLDMEVQTNGTTDTVSVWVNGLLVARGTATGAARMTNSGKMSMYARGKTAVAFEYIYGVDVTAFASDGFGFYDLKYGGVRGGMWEREQVWQTGYRYKRIMKEKYRWGKAPYRKNVYFFDDFGPFVHEVREFEVAHDPNPTQYSTIYNTNDWLSVVAEYYSSPFKSHFTIANIGRTDAILNGDDTLSYGGSEQAISQACVVLGRDLVVEDDQKVTVTDLRAVRARGLIEADLTSDWMQTRAMAQDIADWIVQHWGGGVDSIEVEIFGNPLIEVGDVVNINYTEKNMTTATHVYFVTGVKNDFENGVATTLSLRRLNNNAQKIVTSTGASFDHTDIIRDIAPVLG